MHVYNNVSQNTFGNGKFCRQICRENQNTHFMRKCGIIHRPSQATYDSVVREMHVVWWITKATDTHSECLIPIAFPW